MRGLLRILALALVVLVAGNSARRWQHSRHRQVIREAVHRSDRFVDASVRLNVVVADPNGEELVPGKQRMRVLRSYVRGGVIDTALPVPMYVGPPLLPRDWYCAEQAEEILLHPSTIPSRLLVYGAMGASKTTTSAQWMWLRVLERVGTPGEFGVTAPTNDRAGAIRSAMLELYRRSWRTWRSRDKMFRLVTGHRIRFVTTTQKSRAQGSPIQGWNWLDAISEEMQDSTAVDGDIEARGRSAPEHLPFRRLANATPKDDPEWREWRDRVLSTTVWTKRTMSLRGSPFVPAGHIEDLKQTLTDRDYRRKVDGEDVGPERMLYTSWSRDLNLQPIWRGATDVTARELARFGYPQFSVLVGADPGRIVDVAMLLKAYQRERDRFPSWWVVGEVTTPKTTTAAHVAEVVDILASRFHCNLRDRHGGFSGARALVRIDPYGDQENDDAHPDKTLYTVWRNAGLVARAAAYKTANGKSRVQRIPRGARIDVVNTLLGTQDGTRRLYVACNDNRAPVAPKLVDAFERSARDVAYRAEADRKGPKDVSHWPCATGYAVWEIEHPRIEAMRKRAA